MLKEAEIRTFVEGTTNYFEIAGQQAASVGSPYLVTDGKPGTYEYTGVIGISGARKGIVYFTAPRGMLTVLLMRMQETDCSEETIKDLVGEVANTISGNARPRFRQELRHFGADRGRARSTSRCPLRSYVIPTLGAANSYLQAGAPAIAAVSFGPGGAPPSILARRPHKPCGRQTVAIGVSALEK